MAGSDGNTPMPDLSTDRKSGRKAREELIQSIIQYGSRAFNPDSPPESRTEARQALDNLIQR
jgi:hypothetical protein